ncbi:hypothetical protein NMG60_11024387 [Bertholletia excelsa]
MGSTCCVARKDSTSTNGNGETLRRSAIYSPSWSFRWDNRRRVAGEIENILYEPSHGISTSSSMEMKGEFILDRSNFSSRGSPLGNLETPTSQKSPPPEGSAANGVVSTGLTAASNDNNKVLNSAETPGMAGSPVPKFAFSLPSSSSLSTPTADPLSSQSQPLPPNSIQLRWGAHQSPCHQLLRQVSDNQTQGLKSPNSNIISETAGSHGGSSDGWSMRTFSELVASSQRERCSFDSEILGSSSTFSYSPSSDLQTCGFCSKLLIEKSLWSSQKIISSHELSVIAVLVCGHVYHAECLDALTLEADRFDPSCPICMVGEKQLSKVAQKVLAAEAELRSRSNKVYDYGFDVLDRRKSFSQKEKFPAIASGRRSFGKPFLKRHFSFGSKWNRSLSENNSGRKGFWARYRKD